MFVNIEAIYKNILPYVPYYSIGLVGTICHEFGHAIMCKYYGFKIIKARIYPSLSGYIRINPNKIVAFRKRMAISVIGPLFGLTGLFSAYFVVKSIKNVPQRMWILRLIDYYYHTL
jgi:hypothetical protein